ncbi:MAG: hypothetical protein ACLT8H_09740 [Streptococcus parasanguinis]
MSCAKKGIDLSIDGITVLVAWRLFVPDEQPALKFSSKNKLNCWQEYLIIVMPIP